MAGVMQPAIFLIIIAVSLELSGTWVVASNTTNGTPATATTYDITTEITTMALNGTTPSIASSVATEMSSVPSTAESAHWSEVSSTSDVPNSTATQNNTSVQTTVGGSPNDTTPYDSTYTASDKTDLNTSTHGNHGTAAAVKDERPDERQSYLSRSPGLVAIICIFCIVLVLLLTVCTAKALSSRKTEFERLEDVPMGKVNEESPFAHHH